MKTRLILVAAALMLGGALVWLAVNPPSPVRSRTENKAGPRIKDGRTATGDRTPPPPRHVSTSPILNAFLHGDDPTERVPADFSVRMPDVTDPGDVSAVRRVMRDRQEPLSVRHEAAELLRRSRAPGFVQDLEEIYRDGDEHPTMRAYVLQYCSNPERVV